MLEAVAWGTLAASSLLLGSLLGALTSISERTVGLILGFGAGALISAVSFELTDEALRLGGADATAAGLALGAIAFYAGDRAIERRGGRDRQMMRDRSEGSGTTLLLGALLDGLPEAAVIGTTLIGGGEVGVAVLAAVFLSNFPEGVAGSTGMRAAGASTRHILLAWSAVVVACGAAAGLGYLLLDGASGNSLALLQSFAAGGVLMLLADSMFPNANRMGGPSTGLLTVLGFALAALLSAAG